MAHKYLCCPRCGFFFVPYDGISPCSNCRMTYDGATNMVCDFPYAFDKGINVPNKIAYISRDAAISEILSQPTDAHYPSWYAEKLRQLPAADVRAVVRGTWRERRFSEDVYGAECSVCHTTWDYGTNFCPNCGADMRERRTGNG